MRIALYQPDIPQNTGTILRLCGCLGVEAHIIEPAGFPSSDRAFRRAGMDYLNAVAINRHASWSDFDAWRRRAACRVVLFTTKANMSYLDFNFALGDVLLFGRESAGAGNAFAQCRHGRRARRRRSLKTDRSHEPVKWHRLGCKRLEHDPEKWTPVFGKDHAQTTS
jgi:tRNA (cytidine/uridine-2'-O-)-methyltransferase